MSLFVALSLLFAVVAVRRRSPGLLVAAGAAAGLAASAKVPGAVAVVPVAWPPPPQART
jgi:predicted membrane-bound dolichyl-phosphate-mannose-protein mannosyltransferase